MAYGHQPVGNDDALEAGSLPNTPPIVGVREREVRPEEGRRIVIPDARLRTPETSEAGLLDVGDYVFGRWPYETVIEPEDRVEIEDVDRTPWRRICRLEITAADGRTRLLGTGWLIGRRTVITAGHCVYLHKYGTDQAKWAREILVFPGQRGDHTPHRARSTKFRTVDSWKDNRAQAGDYGAILLDEPLGDTLGWFSIGMPRDPWLINQVVNIAGYPADLGNGRRQYYHSQKIGSVDEHLLFYDVDTYGGQSGSPVWVKLVEGTQERWVAVGIHNMGTDYTRRSNSGTRISREVFDNLNAWKKEGDAP